MIYAAAALTCLFGWLLLPPSDGSGRLPRLGFAFGAGAFAISLQMFAYDRMGIGWSRPTLLLPWAVFAAFVLIRRRDQLRLPSWRMPAWWELALSAGLLIPVFVWLPFERVMPLTSQSWDAWAIWLFKAKAFYLDGGIAPYLDRGNELANHPGYPLLVPLYATFLYTLLGEVADHAAKFLSPCFLLAGWGVFYGFARRFGTPWMAMGFTVMLATVPMVNITAFTLAGYADTALSLYVLASGGFFYAWCRSGRLADLAGASIAANAAAWTKNEGQFFLLGMILLISFRLIKNRLKWPAWAWLLVPAVVVQIPWALLRLAHGVESAGFVLGVDFDVSLFWVALRTLASKAVDLKLFNLTFVVMFAGLLAAPRMNVSKAFWALPALVVWQLIGALLAYSTGRNDIEWWLGTSGDRVLAQVVPLALLSSALLFSHWLQTTPSERAGQGHKSRKPAVKPGNKRKESR